jgi:hypothetical protein
MDLSKLHVIAVVSNPMRFKSRYELFKTFAEDIERKGATLWTVEAQVGVRSHKVTDFAHPRHFQIWGTALDGIVWNKEILQNYLVWQVTQHSPDWRMIVFTDADVKYESNWLNEIANTLQIHPVIQPWSHCVDFGPDGAATTDRMQQSYAYCHWHNIHVKEANAYSFGGHPGYSLAMRREIYNQLGGLIDIGVCGSGDRHMMCAFTGNAKSSFHHGVSQGYKKAVLDWQVRADKYVKGNLGYVPQLCRHLFHGAKRTRGYSSRWQILTKWQFDPYTDLKKEANGLYQLAVEDKRQRGLRDALYKYFKGRLEDANCL